MCCRTRFTQHLSLIRFFSHFQWQQQQIRHSFHIFALDQTLPVLLHFTSCSILIFGFLLHISTTKRHSKDGFWFRRTNIGSALGQFQFSNFFFIFLFAVKGFNLLLQHASTERVCAISSHFFWCVFGVALKFIQNQISSCSV